MTLDHCRAIEGLYACGHALFTQERWADAAAVFRAMVMAAPHEERAWLALGMCHEGAGQIAVAIEMWRVAVKELAPAFRCSVALAKALRSIGRDDEAEEILARAEDHVSTEPEGRALIELARRRS